MKARKVCLCGTITTLLQHHQQQRYRQVEVQSHNRLRRGDVDWRVDLTWTWRSPHLKPVRRSELLFLVCFVFLCCFHSFVTPSCCLLLFLFDIRILACICTMFCSSIIEEKNGNKNAIHCKCFIVRVRYADEVDWSRADSPTNHRRREQIVWLSRSLSFSCAFVWRHLIGPFRQTRGSEKRATKRCSHHFILIRHSSLLLSFFSILIHRPSLSPSTLTLW